MTTRGKIRVESGKDRVLKVLIVSLFLLVSFADPAVSQRGKGMVIFADAVYYNGKVLTVDERFAVAQALAVVTVRLWRREAIA